MTGYPGRAMGARCALPADFFPEKISENDCENIARKNYKKTCEADEKSV